MSRKYKFVVKIPNLPDVVLSSDSDNQVVDWLAWFRMRLKDFRIEVHTLGSPGYEWWDKEDYYCEDR